MHRAAARAHGKHRGPRRREDGGSNVYSIIFRVNDHSLFVMSINRLPAYRWSSNASGTSGSGRRSLRDAL